MRKVIFFSILTLMLAFFNVNSSYAQNPNQKKVSVTVRKNGKSIKKSYSSYASFLADNDFKDIGVDLSENFRFDEGRNAIYYRDNGINITIDGGKRDKKTQNIKMSVGNKTTVDLNFF